jgi:AcrR family transcriptional regulator
MAESISEGSSQTSLKILSAADEIFYVAGFYGATVGAIAARAGVTKETLYSHFRSKEDLMAAYLDNDERLSFDRFQTIAGRDGTVIERLERIFDYLCVCARSNSWRGCGFVHAMGELAGLFSHPAMQVARAYKLRFEGWLCRSLQDEGYADNAEIARALISLIDGTVIHSLLHRSPAYALAAKKTATLLLHNQTNRATIPCVVIPFADRARQ